MKTPDLDISVPQRDPEAYIASLVEHLPDEKDGIRGVIQHMVDLAEWRSPAENSRSTLPPMIRTSSSGPVTTLLLDAPERKNAFDETMLRQLCTDLRAADADSACRCVVVRGANGTFCAGRNLAELPDRGVEAVLAREGVWEEVSQILHRASTPSVAVVEGYAVAGGFTLAMACDFVVAEASATFGAFEMSHGFPAALCTPLLAKLAPARMALEWGMLGQPIPARRLHEIGLVNRIADGPEALDEMASEFVGQLAALEPEAVAMTLELHRAAGNMPRADALAMGKQQNVLITASGMLERAMKRFASSRR